MTTADDIVQVITAVAALGAAWLGAINRKHIGGVKDHIGEVHELVNDHADKQEARVEQLAGALTTAGVDIPAPPPTPAADLADLKVRLAALEAKQGV